MIYLIKLIVILIFVLVDVVLTLLLFLLTLKLDSRDINWIDYNYWGFTKTCFRHIPEDTDASL